jgi:membrane protein DedA with SNARE-associated domain
MHLAQIFEYVMDILVTFISQIGYLGIFIGMFLESTMLPIPSELVMIPAGISSSYGNMNLSLVIFVGVLGNVTGAIFSYYLAILLGRPILLKIGKYFFVKPKDIAKIERFFESHGNISVFIGRLVPGVRHFISLPAGIAKMNFKTFCFYTTIGSALWTSILTFLGYGIGANKDLIEKYLHLVILSCVIICIITISFYIFYRKRSSKQ